LESGKEVDLTEDMKTQVAEAIEVLTKKGENVMAVASLKLDPSIYTLDPPY